MFLLCAEALTLHPSAVIEPGHLGAVSPVLRGMYTRLFRLLNTSSVATAKAGHTAGVLCSQKAALWPSPITCCIRGANATGFLTYGALLGGSLRVRRDGLRQAGLAAHRREYGQPHRAAHESV